MPTLTARALIGAAVATVVLAFPLAAGAKEPTRATVEGPGLPGAITITKAPLAALAQQSGFAPGVFGHRDPDPMLRDKPAGDLGPKYTVTYTIWGADGNPVEQHVYPYALPRPVTYLPAGQPFNTGMETYGGWFRADPALKKTLVAAGLPRVAPSARGSDSSFAAVGIIGVVLLAIVAVAVFVRLRWRHATA